MDLRLFAEQLTHGQRERPGPRAEIGPDAAGSNPGGLEEADVIEVIQCLPADGGPYLAPSRGELGDIRSLDQGAYGAMTNSASVVKVRS